MGLRQLFRYLDKLPTFSLVDTGRLRIMKKGGGGGGGGGGGIRPRTSGQMSASNWSGAGEAEAAKDQDEFGEEEEEEECREIEEGGGEEEEEEEEEDGGMWRTYRLQCEEMTCLIHEEFHKDAWDLF